MLVCKNVSSECNLNYNDEVVTTKKTGQSLFTENSTRSTAIITVTQWTFWTLDIWGLRSCPVGYPTLGTDVNMQHMQFSAAKQCWVVFHCLLVFIICLYVCTCLFAHGCSFVCVLMWDMSGLTLFILLCVCVCVLNAHPVLHIHMCTDACNSLPSHYLVIVFSLCFPPLF